ncbi:hypothetical protein HFO55_21670 [Rhizobium leguminosarum]|nr:hypothetical protein [Rhizobium leguminosarum]MBY5569835.1 hypothetical protein [Rhizobium leguminosarum]MBY5575857.1 hypothetical protein [Rhizobium leguminosarum]
MSSKQKRSRTGGVAEFEDAVAPVDGKKKAENQKETPGAQVRMAFGLKAA